MGKQYAILRVQKCKGAEIGAMQYHNDREPGKHTNPDIDQSRTRLNREMCPHADYEGEVQARIDAGYKGTRKVRKDAVRLVEGIVTASPEFFEGASAEEVRDFFEDALGFCREEFGESNLVHFTVHMDEETPHAHFGFVPLKDGKLSWKGFFPDKAALGAMQDRFYGRVGALYGLSRGEKRLEGQPARRHKSVAEYKAESRRVQAELDEKAELLVSARAELVSANADVAENGKVVTDEMIADWESALERDEWPSGWVNVGEIVEGKLPKAAPETVTLSLKVPAAMKRALEKEAKAEGKSTGAYARGILADGLMAIA